MNEWTNQDFMPSSKYPFLANCMANLTLGNDVSHKKIHQNEVLWWFREKLGISAELLEKKLGP